MLPLSWLFMCVHESNPSCALPAFAFYVKIWTRNEVCSVYIAFTCMHMKDRKSVPLLLWLFLYTHELALPLLYIHANENVRRCALLALILNICRKKDRGSCALLALTFHKCTCKVDMCSPCLGLKYMHVKEGLVCSPCLDFPCMHIKKEIWDVLSLHCFFMYEMQGRLVCSPCLDF